MEYHILGLDKKEEWKKYLVRLPISQQDIYYTPKYYSLYQNNIEEVCCFVFIKKNNLLQKNDRVVIGFSGGPDSVFLVEALESVKKEYTH